jgi:hypothetical protein
VNPAPATVLDLWEAGLPRTPAARAVLLLEAAGEADAGGWAVGRSHLALLAAYCDTGRGLEALADCPECGAALDVAVDPGALTGGGAESVTVADGEYAVTARPPTLGDLEGLSPTDYMESLRRQLLARCVVEATVSGEAVPTDELPGHVVDRVEAALDEADPAADLQLALACPECEATWSDSLDPLVFAWSAVEGAARRLATDVHTLAHAYGWSEQEILALSPFRRHLYLSAVQS